MDDTELYRRPNSKANPGGNHAALRHNSSIIRFTW